MSEREFKIKELERLFSEQKISLDQYLNARATIEKGQVPLTEPQHFSSQNYSVPTQPPRTPQPIGPQRSYKKIIIGVILALIVFASGFLAWGYLNPGSPVSILSAEALTIEGHSIKASKGAIIFSLKNTGNTNIQITDVKMNGHPYQSYPPVFTQGWNGTTFLQPQQTGSLNVYAFTYAYAINSSIPHLSSPPTETELDNYFSWLDSDCTFTFVTSTQHQYDAKVNAFTAYGALAWMGSLTFTFMKTEELKVQSHTWATSRTSISLTVKNTGTGGLTISEVRVNDVVASNVTFTSGSATLNAGDSATLRVAPVSGTQFSSGTKYEFAMLTATGNKYTYVATAP